MVNTDIFLGSQASLTFVPELDLSLYLDTTSNDAITYNGTVQTAKEVLVVDATFSDRYLLVPDLYIGCTIDLYDTTDTATPVSTHTIVGNNGTQIKITPAHTHTIADAADVAIIRSYGAPCIGAKNGSVARLNADNWLGLLETGTFPSVEQEMKQLNLSLGGSRNFTHQYKGIQTASGGNLALMANHGAWLYYALGACSTVKVRFSTVGASGVYSAPNAGDVFINTQDAAAVTTATNVSTHNNTGPIFYKTGNGVASILPPVLAGSDTPTALGKVVESTSANFSGTNANAITYTFIENNAEDLPSFALEHSILKTPTTLTTETGDASESQSFVRIARGNRVNTLTMTANENEEVKMTMDLNTSNVHKLARTDAYEARNGQAVNTSMFNYPASADAAFLEPFFFSNGSFSIFGQQFLKITNLTLTINNSITDKRFIGVGSKNVKRGLVAQRTYEVAFTALVTDDKLFEELFNQTEETSSDTIANGLLDLTFSKANGEEIKIQLKEYFLDSANITVPEDLGPITIEGTVKPRSLNLCTVTTHWLLQG
jgi:hypothetical protein